MGLSLADAAVRGNTQSTNSIADEKQSLLAAGDTEGLIRFNRAIFGAATMMAKEDDADDDDDDDSDDDDEDDSDDDDDEDDDSDDDDEDDKARGKKTDPKDERIRELSAEAKKRRLRARRDRQRIADLEAETARLKGKGKSKAKKDEDDEDDESESEETATLKQENEALKERLARQTIRQEFTDLLSKPKQKIKFKDPKIAFKLLDLDDVEVDEDGDVDGLEDAIKELAEEAPYLLAGNDDKDEDDEDEDKPKRRTGQRSGSRNGKSKKPDQAALIAKYGIKR